MLDDFSILKSSCWTNLANPSIIYSCIVLFWFSFIQPQLTHLCSIKMINILSKECYNFNMNDGINLSRSDNYTMISFSSSMIPFRTVFNTSINATNCVGSSLSHIIIRKKTNISLIITINWRNFVTLHL